MKKRGLILILMFLMVMPGVGLANHGGHHGEGSEGGFALEDMYFGKVYFLFKNKAELGLTEEQMEQIKTIKFDVQRATIDAEAKKDLAMLDMVQELHKDQPDVKKLNSVIDQKYAVKTNLAKTVVQSILNTKSILTAEQQAKAKELYWKN